MKTVHKIFWVVAILAVAASLLAFSSFPSAQAGQGNGNHYGWDHSAAKPTKGAQGRTELKATHAAGDDQEEDGPELDEEETTTPGTPAATLTDEPNVVPTDVVTFEPTETVEPSQTDEPTDVVTATSPAPSETVSPTPETTATGVPSVVPSQTAPTPVIHLDPTPRHGPPSCPPRTAKPILKMFGRMVLPLRWFGCIAS